MIRGQRWGLIPNLRGAAAVTIDSGARAQVFGFFTNGATRAFDFLDSEGTGGGEALVVAGGSEAANGVWIGALAEGGVRFVNSSINPQSRLPYVDPDWIPGHQLNKGLGMRIDPSVPGDRPIHLTMHTVWSRPENERSYEIHGGHVVFKMTTVAANPSREMVVIDGGRVTMRNSRLTSRGKDGDSHYSKKKHLLRIWTSEAGSQLAAKLITRTEDVVVLETVAGGRIEVAPRHLSRADQEFLRR